MDFSISLFVNDGRPVAPLHICNVTGTLDDAKRTIDLTIASRPNEAYGPVGRRVRDVVSGDRGLRVHH